jgi:DNA helicase-2/ATP-dependent DNA helicase PcrA
MASDVVRWTGGPGSGKTYQLLEMVRGEVETGRTLDDMILMTFSRSQAADLADRLARSVFPDEDQKDILRRCATVDAITLRAVRAAGLISQSPDQIIVPTGKGAKKAIPVYREFMQAHGIPYTPNAYAPEDGDPVARAKLPAGNQILEINAYLSATMQPPAAWQYAAAALSLPFNGAAWDITDLLPAWQEFKTQRGVFEHADYVRLAVTDQVEPQAPIIFIDEYQDVSPLQDALIRQWIEQADRVYVAGDPDQSIYGFRGCSPDLFLSLPAEDRGAHNGDRPVSHRCPVRIMATAEELLSAPANVAPAPRPGISARIVTRDIFDLVRHIEDAVRTYADTVTPIYILSRFRRHAGKIARDLAAAGIPTTGIRSVAGGPWGPARIGRHKDTLERDTVNIWHLTRAVRRYQEGTEIDRIPLDEAEALIAATVPQPRRKQITDGLAATVKRGDPIRIGALTPWIPAPSDRIQEALNIRPYLTDQIQRCITRERRRGSVIAPHAVRVDTIHASKGLEAPAVFLHTGYLRGLIDGLSVPDRMAEERRVFFVGATRASRALILFDYIAPVWPVFGRPV